MAQGSGASAQPIPAINDSDQREGNNLPSSKLGQSPTGKTFLFPPGSGEPIGVSQPNLPNQHSFSDKSKVIPFPTSQTQATISGQPSTQPSGDSSSHDDQADESPQTNMPTQYSDVKDWFKQSDKWNSQVIDSDPSKRAELDVVLRSLSQVQTQLASSARPGVFYNAGKKLPLIDFETGQLIDLPIYLGTRSADHDPRTLYPTDLVSLGLWLQSVTGVENAPPNQDRVRDLIGSYFNQVTVDQQSGFDESSLYQKYPNFGIVLGSVQAKLVELEKAPVEKELETAEEVNTGEAVDLTKDVATAGTIRAGGPVGETIEGAGGDTGAEGKLVDQPTPTAQPQPAPVGMPGVVTDAERTRRQAMAYESAWLKNAILQDLCRQHGITPSTSLMDSLQDVIFESLGGLSQDELRSLFANTSGRLQKLRELQTKLTNNVQFVQELNQLYDAHYISLAKVDENKAREFREKTDYVPSQKAVKEVKFASEEKLKQQLENPVDVAVNQAINQLTGHEPFSAEQLQSLELVLTQLATGLGDKGLAAELGLPINPNQLDIKDYIQSLDDVALYRLLYGKDAKPNKAVLAKLKANIDQVKQNLTNTCQTIIAQKSIDFRVEGFAQGASSHLSDINPKGDLRESPLDIAIRVVPVISGSLFAPEAAALVQSENRLSEANADYKQFVKNFATTFNALDSLTQEMLIREAGMDPAVMKDFDGSYKFNDQLMRAAGRLSAILRQANKAREIKRKVDERLKQTHDLSLSQVQELERLSGELKRLGLHSEADQLQKKLKESFKAQLDSKQRLVFDHLEQLTSAERALKEAEFQVRMARTHANTHQVLLETNQPTTDVVSAYLTARSAAFAASATADQALKKLVDLPPDQKEIATELAEKRMRVEKQLSDLKSELGGLTTAKGLGSLPPEEYQRIYRDFANNPFYFDSQGGLRQLWIPISDEVYDSGQFEEPVAIQPISETGIYDAQPAEFGWNIPASDFDLDYNDFVGGDEYIGGEIDLVDQYNQTLDMAQIGRGKSKTRQLAGQIKKKVQAKKAAKKVAEQATKKTTERAVEAGSTLVGAASGPVGWVAKGAMIGAKILNMLRTKEGRKKLGMYLTTAGGAAISFYLALKGAMGAAAGGLAGALAVGATGAMIGSLLGPAGTLVGGLIGGSIGAIGGYIKGGGSFLGLGGSSTALTLPTAPAYYSPTTPTLTPTPIASTTTLPPSQTTLGSGVGQPSLSTGLGSGGVKTQASLSQGAVNDSLSRLSTQPQNSQLVPQTGGQWIDPTTGYSFDPNTGQVYDAAGQPVASAGSTITTGTAAGAAAGTIGIAAVIGPLGLSGAAFFMPAISVLSVMFITLLTIITIFAAFLTPTPVGTGFRSDPGATANRYLELKKEVTPSSVPNEAVEGTNEAVVQYKVTITPKSGYQIRLTQNPKDEMYSLPDPPKSPAKKAVWQPTWSALSPYLTRSSFPEIITQPTFATYNITFTDGKDALVMNEVKIYYDVLSPNGEVVVASQEWTAFTNFTIGNPDVLCWPTTGEITWLPYNINPSNHPNFKENAYDIGGAKGAGVYSPFAGTAIGRYHGQYGNYVAVSFRFGPHVGELFFAHLNEIDPLIGKNKFVPISAGQKIGTMGSTGSTSTGIHLHYELKKNNNFNDNFSLLIPPRVGGGNYRIGDQVRTCYPLSRTP